MKNNYLLIGQSSDKLDVVLNNLLSSISDYEIIKYDAGGVEVFEIIRDASTPSMFFSKKVIVVENFGNIHEKDLEEVYNYLNSYNSSSYLFFLCVGSFDKRKKIYKWFSENESIVSDDDFDIKKYIKDYLKNNDFKIDDINVKFFLDYVGSNINDIKNELDKLMLLKNDDKIIVKDDIDSITSNNFDDNIFNFTKAVLDGDVKKSLELYQEFSYHGYDEIALINILAGQFRTLYQVKSLSNMGKSNKEISSILEFSNPYRVNMCLKNACSYSESDLLKYIYILGKMDLKIKKGLVDKKSVFELFLINKNIASL